MDAFSRFALVFKLIATSVKTLIVCRAVRTIAFEICKYTVEYLS